MALTLANKALISGAVATSLGGAIYGAYTLLSTTETVKEALIKQGIDPLNLENKSAEDTELLKELAKQYHSNKPTTTKQKIEGFQLTSDAEFEKLETKCKELLNTKSDNKDFDKNLKHATDWCSKSSAPRTVVSLLKSRNKELLPQSGGTTTDWDGPWKTFKNKYNGKTPDGAWVISNWSSVNGVTSPVPETFKQKCTENGKQSIMEKEQATFLEEIITYCTKATQG